MPGHAGNPVLDKTNRLPTSLSEEPLSCDRPTPAVREEEFLQEG